MGVIAQLKHGWNAFLNRTDDQQSSWVSGSTYASRPDRPRLNLAHERSLLSSIYTRLAIDVAAVDIRHARLDKDGRYSEDMTSGLQDCLTVEANIDQAPRHFRQDLAFTLFDQGAIAIVPVDTTLDPAQSGSFDIKSLRVGHIVQWWPQHVTVSLYNDKIGRREEVKLEKRFVAIVENPLYAVMNEPNSTLQRLTRKLNLLDAIDEASGSGKLDLIIQLPYVVKSEARKEQAEQRMRDIEIQLSQNKMGVAYTDGTEKITQLNRPVENKLMGQIEYLTAMLYEQLGLTKAVMEGTADESAMLNYHNRTIEPILTAIVEAMRRAFLTKTARSQRQSILYFRDPFKLVPINVLAEVADKFTRNEILTSNEIRQIVGFRPMKDKKADELRNSNMPESELGTGKPPIEPTDEKKGDGQNGSRLQRMGNQGRAQVQ
jgi:hypothetical protein